MSQDEDILSELVKTVKDLSEKNFNLALKVNELEKKIEQTDQNAKDISQLKSKSEAANTDRTAIKDLLNLKIGETYTTLDQKLNSFKNDFSYLKEDLKNLDAQNADFKKQLSSLSDELQNSFKILSDETIKQIENLKNDHITKIQQNSDSLADLSSKFETSTTQLSEKLDQVNNSLSGTIKNLDESNKAQFEKILSETATEFNRLSEETDQKVQTVNESFDSKLQQIVSDTDTKFENHHGIINNLSSQTDLTINGLNKRLDKFFEISTNHSDVLKVFEEIIGQIHANIEQNALEAKRDQELLLESFQKIIVGQAENLRNELLTFSKEIRTNLSKFNEEITNKFTPMDESTKINDRIKSLDENLRLRSENIRKELIETLDDNVKKFDTSIKDSISSVDEYRVDLERFKDDIESLIERKVNEKTEFSMELFNNLLTKAEQISKLVQDSRVSKVPKIAVPVPEIKTIEPEEN